MSLSSVAKTFLANILRIENSITSEQSDVCFICHERCGTLSPETGIMELEVRLPCNHTVGSGCIATWLADNNSCPLCRREFFPRHPHLSMRYDNVEAIGNEEPSDVPRTQGESVDDSLARLARNRETHDNPLPLALLYCQPLRLGLHVAILARGIADTADSMVTLRNDSVESIAAASVYIASHILNQTRSLADVARETTLTERAIHNVYRAIYSDRYKLVDENWRDKVGGSTLGEAAEALPSLPWPPLQQEFIDNEDQDMESVDAEHDIEPSAISSIKLVKELCFLFHLVANHSSDINYGRSLWSLACKIADRMDNMTLDWSTVNPWTIAAACTYMASHLVCQGMTLEEVARISGIPSASIRDTYEVMYRVRDEILQETWFANLYWTRSVLVDRLPRPWLLLLLGY